MLAKSCPIYSTYLRRHDAATDRKLGGSAGQQVGLIMLTYTALIYMEDVFYRCGAISTLSHASPSNSRLLTRPRNVLSLPQVRRTGQRRLYLLRRHP